MNRSEKWAKAVERTLAVTLLLLSSPTVLGQFAPPAAKAAEATQEPAPDPLGRNTPRGAILSFLKVARTGNGQVAALYLSTSLRGADAEVLAHQLAVVLNRRLPAKLNEVSDKPEGSLRDPIRPEEDLIGTISTSKGDLDIIVERIDRGKAGKVWLFSRKTLDSIPDVFNELSTPPVEKILPEFLVSNRAAGVPIFEWLAVFVGMPFLYLLTVVLNRLLSLGIGAFRRQFFGHSSPQNPQVLPPPIRLLLVAFLIRQLLSLVGLPLLARQFWSTTALVIDIAGCTWLLMLLTRWGERYLMERRSSMSGSAAVLRLFRRMINGLILFAALLFALHRFGINPTAALAGLGVGGIAVALAAQKTLENVIAGVSLIADQAVRVGDTLKLSEVLGTVEDVGLRSTRIRTPDRTVVCVPNSQIANISLETLSARDKFWFHPVVALRYETTPDQLRSIITRIRNLLMDHSNVDSTSVRVSFLRINTFSLDVEIVAYVSAADWAHFLQIQEELLLSAMNIVNLEGTAMAYPSQTMYLAAHSSEDLAHLAPEFARRDTSKALHDEPGVPH